MNNLLTFPCDSSNFLLPKGFLSKFESFFGLQREMLVENIPQSQREIFLHVLFEGPSRKERKCLEIQEGNASKLAYVCTPLF